MMKRILVFAIAAFALGLWGGMRAWQSATVAVTFQAGLAFVIACNLLLCLWLWYRARPGSGDAIVLPSVALMSASMLVGILPRLLWPDLKGLQLAGTIVSVIVVTVLLTIQIRHRLRLRRNARAA
jgi:hypothetical protein